MRLNQRLRAFVMYTPKVQSYYQLTRVNGGVEVIRYDHYVSHTCMELIFE